MLEALDEEAMVKPLDVLYTNANGEKRVRTVIPCGIIYGTRPDEVGPQWFLKCYDLNSTSFPHPNRGGGKLLYSLRYFAVQKLFFDKETLKNQVQLRNAYAMEGDDNTEKGKEKEENGDEKETATNDDGGGDPDPIEKTRVYCCPFCDKLRDSPTSLKAHMVVEHHDKIKCELWL